MLYYGSIRDIEDSYISIYENLLPVAMKHQVQRFFSNDDKKHRLLARLMLRYCLIQTTGNDKLLHTWKVDDNGKPFIDNWFEFNISHSGDFVVFGYDVSRVGLDIEKIESIDYNLFIDNFHFEESRFIEKSKSKILDFYNIWVKKESILKAIGVGIVEGINKFSCVNEYVFYKNQLWYFYPIGINASYICYACIQQTNQLIIERFSILQV